MPSRRSGHLVQISRPVGDWTVNKLVEVEGRQVSTHASPSFVKAYGSWTAMSRELPLRDAKRYAKAYARAGFKTRVILVMNSGQTRVVTQYRPKGDSRG